MTRRFWAAICAAALALPLAVVGIAMIPSAQANNKGDAWLTNNAVTANGHDHVPHLDCSLIYLHGSSLDDTGTYTIDSIPGTGSGKTIWSGTWTTPASGDVLTTVTGTALVDAAIAQDGAVANLNQGYHFELTLVQGPGDNNGDVKHKTFWVKCGEVPPAPSITVVKTADAASVTAGSPIGFTVTVGLEANSFADSATLNDPLPLAPGLNWSISPAYTGPGTCAITGVAPAQQTLTCAFGDLGDAAEGPTSASVHVTSPTTVDTAPLTALLLTNTATAAADQVGPETASATVNVTPAAPNLTIVKTADAVTATAGATVGFGINVANEGPGTAVSTTLNDPLPHASGVSWAISPAYSGPGTCAITGTAPSQTLICTFGSLSSGGSASVHITSATPAGTVVSLNNVATASALNNPTVTGTAQISTVEGSLAPALSITKTADSVTATAGDTVGFTIAVANAGPGSATSVTINDPLPAAGGTWVITPAYSGPGLCSLTGASPSQTLACSLGNLAAGATASVHVAVTTPTGTAVTLVNTATALATNNPSVSATAQVAVTAVLGTTTTTPTTTVLGENITRNVLPVTGSNVALLAIPALGLIAVGFELLYLERKRRAAASR